MSKILILKDLCYTFLDIRLYNKMLKESCYWTSESMAEYQYQKIKHFLIESYQGIPYGRKLFDSLLFNPQTDFNSISDLTKLPVLSKEIVKQNKDIFVYGKYTRNSILFKTSGSTGVPFKYSFIQSNEYLVEKTC